MGGGGEVGMRDVQFIYYRILHLEELSTEVELTTMLTGLWLLLEVSPWEDLLLCSPLCLFCRHILRAHSNTVDRFC